MLQVDYVVLSFNLIFTPSQLGNVYIADSGNNRIRKVTISTGIITTIVGSGGTGSYSGDSGVATSATLNYPIGIALDASGILQLLQLRNSVLLFFSTR